MPLHPTKEVIPNFELEEAESFRKDVQGARDHSRLFDDDEDDEYGPSPMVQPKDYAEDKKVRIKTL